MPGSILVTGASGNVGREVVRELSRLGQPALAGVPDAAAARQVPPEAARTVLLDFEQPATYPAALAGVARLFLLRPPAMADVRRGLFPFIDAAQAAGVQHVVFLSLMGVNPLMPHYQVEQKLKRSGLGYTLLRASFFMQNLDTVYRAGVRAQSELYLPAGRARTSFIDVRDVAAVAARALTDPGHRNQAYTLTGSQALDYFEVAQVFTQVLGRPIRYLQPTPLAYGRRLRAEGVRPEFIRVMQGIYFTVRLGLGARVTAEVQQLLGRPPIRLEQYVRDYAACWQPA